MEWIEVSKKLPKMGQLVLLVAKEPSEGITFCVNDMFAGWLDFDEEGEMCWNIADGCYCELDFASYWTPVQLPRPKHTDE